MQPDTQKSASEGVDSPGNFFHNYQHRRRAGDYQMEIDMNGHIFKIEDLDLSAADLPGVVVSCELDIELDLTSDWYINKVLLDNGKRSFEAPELISDAVRKIVYANEDLCFAIMDECRAH